MLQAMNTGHEGSIATVHANSTEDAITRLETLASMTDLSIPFEALRDQVNSAIDVIVQLERSIDGSRRIVEVAAVASRRRETFRLQTIANYDFDPIGPERIVTGKFRHFQMPDVLLKRLVLAGETLPAAFTSLALESEAPEREAT
jgi:pilus assembly protein CpaF